MKVLALFFFFIISLFLLGCSEERGDFAGWCYLNNFSEENNKNDTNLFIFENRAAYDTTANSIDGVVIDFKTRKPIAKALIRVYQDSTRQFFTTTDEGGKFQIFKNNFSGKWDISVKAVDYRCLLIKDVSVNGALFCTYKLHPY